MEDERAGSLRSTTPSRCNGALPSKYMCTNLSFTYIHDRCVCPITELENSMLTQSLDQRDLCARTGLGSCLGGPLLTSPHGPYGCTRSFIWWIILLSLGYVTRPLKSLPLQDLLSRQSETLSKCCNPLTKTIFSAPL